MKSHLKLALTEGTNRSIIMLLVGASLSGIILLSTYDFVLETITVGTFVSFMFAMPVSYTNLTLPTKRIV